MKALIGIDQECRYIASLNLLARLELQDPVWHLSHVRDTFLSANWYGRKNGATVLDRTDLDLGTSRELLEEATQYARDLGIEAIGYMPEGSVSDTLIRQADDLDIDLICIGSGKPRNIRNFMLGSVERALEIKAHQSVLVARGAPEQSGPLTAVFATDGSKHCEAAFDKLLRWRPKGLKSVTVLSSTEHSGPWDFEANTDQDVWDELAVRASMIQDKLQACGIEAHTRITEVPIRKAIDSEIRKTKADLLVMGAEGHSFVDRLSVGSVALDEVSNAEFSVLVMRA
jgi:nucleotide-binding universal stress UspA family protein